MGDFTNSMTVDAPAETVFHYLADVGNLPRYFDRMRSATAAGDGAVRTTADLPDGRQVEGEAWFRVQEADQRIEWGSEGQSQYHGHLDVRASGTGSEVEVHVHTERVEDGNEAVRDGVTRTLAAIKAQLEGS